VTQPARRVDARQVATEIRASSNWEIESNWSGFELRAAELLPTYDMVEGEWNVPSVSPESGFDQTVLSAFWIGLDGDGPACQGVNCATFGDLWQAGTMQQATEYLWTFSFSSYWAWSEFLPFQPSSQELANFNVSPGDLMYSAVWFGNWDDNAPSSFPTLSGAYAIADVEDITRAEYTLVHNPLGSMAGGIPGYEAEWIMERPGTGTPGKYYDLANYKEAFMYDAYALQTICAICGTNGSWVNYDGANNQDIWMYNGDLLSVPFVYNHSAIQYNWYNFH
jgi:Peptidase A4 family